MERASAHSEPLFPLKKTRREMSNAAALSTAVLYLEGNIARVISGRVYQC